MKEVDLATLNIDQLVGRFTELGIAQGQAADVDDRSRFKHTFDEMTLINNELKARGFNARLALVSLFNHPDPQVRLQAATCSYVVAPDAARKCLQGIGDSKIPPQYLDARMTFQFIDDGTSMLD